MLPSLWTLPHQAGRRAPWRSWAGAQRPQSPSGQLRTDSQGWSSGTGQRPLCLGALSSCWGTVWLTEGRMKKLCQEKETCRFAGRPLRESDQAENTSWFNFHKMLCAFFSWRYNWTSFHVRHMESVSLISWMHCIPLCMGTAIDLTLLHITLSPRFCHFKDHSPVYCWLLFWGIHS